jgi:3-oxoadipate enol-lactonase
MPAAISLRHREAGEGLPLLLVHGFPFHAGMWEAQLLGLSDVARVIAPDLRGFGMSDPGGVAPLTMEDHAADLAALLDELGIRQAVVCGLSMGGYVALAFWRLHRDRVRGLVLADTKAAPDTEEARRGRFDLAQRVRDAGTGVAVDALLPKLLSEHTLREQPAVEGRLRQIMEGTLADTVARALHGMAERPDATPLLGEIDVPTLVIAGEDDALIPPAEGRKLAEAIPGARLQLIAGAGHVPPMEAPDEFNRVLEEFLGSLS